MSSLKRRALILLVFVVAGPPMGATGIVLVGMVYGLAQGTVDPVSAVGGGLIMWLIAVAFSFFLGFLPALVTGVFAALLTDHVKNHWLWAAILTLVGAAAAHQFGRGIGAGGGDAFGDRIVIVGTGAFAAFTCALLTRGFRSPAEEPDADRVEPV